MLNAFQLIRPVTVADGPFTRNSIATYIGKDGYLKQACANEPRFQYDSAGVPQGLLYETSAATNLLKNTVNLQSSGQWVFGATLNTGWTTVSEATLTGPDGVALGDGRVAKFTATATPNSLFLQQTLASALTNATTYTQSIWVYVPTQGGVTSWGIQVGLNSIDASVVTNSTVFGQWVRVPVQITTTGARTQLNLFVAFNNAAPASGNIFYVYGPQLESGSAMTSYFPNYSTTAAGTRAAETLSGMVSNIPEPYGPINTNAESLNNGSAWATLNLTVTADAVAAPYTTAQGSLSAADALVPSATNAGHELYSDLGVSSGGLVTASGYFQANGYSAVTLSIRNQTDTIAINFNVDLTNGNFNVDPTAGTAIVVGVKVTQVPGTSWYRAQVTGYLPSQTIYRLAVFVWPNYANGYASFAGNGTSGVYAWGVMMNLGPYAVAYPVTAQASTVANDPEPWASALSYAVGAKVTRSSVHKVYQRLVAGTTATAPENDTTNWVYARPTSKWTAFDAVNESQAFNADDVQYAIAPGVMCDSVMLDNLDADSVRCFAQGSSYDQTVTLKTRPCSNWFQYYFETFVYKRTAIFTGLPLVTTNLINVILRKATSIAKVGTCVPGFARNLGYAEPGVSVGIIDYSTKSTDQFGSTTVVKRAYSKRMNISVIIENSDLDLIQQLLADYRATPVPYVAAGNSYAALAVYGYYRSFDIVIAYPTQSRCNLEIEGLT